jgi:hypothetical protein
MSELNIEVTEQPASMPQVQIPACQNCGRQDETLRLVVYPFVFSIVFMTFRRALTGLWCKTHRSQNLTIASIISSVFGWVGIPFGIIFTPIVLFQLAQGGVQPADANVQILTTLAEDKLKKGDTAAAVRCLEECLKFRDDPEIKKRLNELHLKYRVEEESIGCLQTASRLTGSLIISVLIGTGIGILDYGSRYFLSLLLGNETPLFLAILGWAPLLGGAFIGGLGLAEVIERTLLRIQSKSLGLAVAFAVIASFLVVYGIFEGFTIWDNIVMVATGQATSIGEIIVVSVITLVAGGIFGLLFILQSINFNWLYLIIVIIATIYFLSLGIWVGRKTIYWQQRIKVDLT